MASRRESLKIIGAIGTTCAFPFSADELYGQHVHRTETAPPEPQGPYTPRFFSAAEFETLSQMAETIIPATGTPGAIAAGVPRYIDEVASANPEHRKRLREGIEWLDRESKSRFHHAFAKLDEAQRIELLTPLSAAVDTGKTLSAPQRFFQLVKNLTADGYYTSRDGLAHELGYAGNTVLEKFPSCELPEH